MVSVNPTGLHVDVATPTILALVQKEDGIMTIEGLRPLPLLLGRDAAELWPLVNLVLPTWFLIAFFPRWKHTPALALVGPILHAVLYTLGALSTILYPAENAAPIDFSSLEGIVALFRDPTGVFIGWVHYCVYDALVGRWIAMDAVERGASNLVYAVVVVPVLFLSLMFGPMGWLLYVSVVRTFVLKGEGGAGGAKGKVS